ncbi:MAG: DUF2157 domain-containing protein [Verrucomicrobia bacterium]|nr:DUF2157 domain-containing protein [Verrucomicrobiota bacterium]
MKSNRSDILDWVDQGRIPNDKLRDALSVAEVLPQADDWRRFLDRMFLFMGVVLLAAGVIFFFAFNWQGLGRFAKFALAEVPIIAALAVVWRLGVDSIAGKATLLFVSLLTGALLALVGQTYQTGADTVELFAVWAVAILPWVLVARFPALWIVWLALVNVAASLALMTFRNRWSIVYTPDKLMWVLFELNTVALIIWECLAVAGLKWLRERWSVRIIATASGGLITALAFEDIVDGRYTSHWGWPLWLGWIFAAYFAYRHWIRDVYVLAVGVLSVIVIIATLIVNSMGSADAGLFLLVGLLIIGLSAAGGYWLKQVAKEEES